MVTRAHPVHEIALFADQRRRAGIDTSGNSLKGVAPLHRPAFLDRVDHRSKESLCQPASALARPDPPQLPRRRSDRPTSALTVCDGCRMETPSRGKAV